MKKSITKLFFGFLLAMFIFTLTGMPKTVEAATLYGNVTSKTLKIRDDKDSSATCIKTLKKGKKVIILESGEEWVQIKVGGVIGYTRGKYIKTAYGNASNLYANAITGTIKSSSLKIRAAKKSSSECLVVCKKGDKIQVLTTGSTWVKVKVGDIIGYTRGKYIKTKKGTASVNSSKGSAVIAYAKRFLGNRYVWGGSSLTHGTDCSGYVMSVYRHFGKSLPHSSSALRHVGRAVKGGIKNAKPGDIICYSGHVALYMGGNRVIHASNPKSGIKITNNASYRHIVAIRRIF